MQRLWLFLLFLWPVVARGDVINATFGTPVRLSPDKSQVRLEREQVRADVFYDFTEVRALYRFRNEGGATTLAIGFPEIGKQLSGYYAKRGGYARFEARVDSQPLKTQRQTAPLTEGNFTHEITRRVGRVHFARGQTRLVEVYCRTTPHESLLFGADFNYVFNDASWEGNVGRSDITVRFQSPGAYVLNAYMGTDDYFESEDAVPLRVREANAFWTRSNWQPEGRFLLSISPTLVPDFLVEASDEDADWIRPHTRAAWVPGEARGLDTAAFWLPPALVRDGVTFVRLDHVEQQFKKSERKVKLDWEGYSNVSSVSAATRVNKGRATLWTTLHKLQFDVGSRTARFDGREVQLPAAPFVAKELGHDIPRGFPVYVPLLPLAKALGAKATVEREKHRFSFRLTDS